MDEPARGAEFGAHVFKIARDEKGARLTFLKVTGGTLTVKQTLSGEGWEEKADQLRLYSGSKFTLLQQAPAGTVCAVTGLSKTMPGDVLGRETAAQAPVLQPVLEYRLLLEDGTDAALAYGQLRVLEEEDPALHLVWNALLREIRVQLMGPVQMEILQKLIESRFGLKVSFDAGNIVYLETIAAPVEGVGHYEPLRHYAEVHLLMEPAEPGSGLQFDTMCPTDTLALHWQRLILAHLAEKAHRGVLTGAPITDIRFTLVSGKAHLKHTEGGDFRQATYRAVRQGLMKAQSVLLEPWYAFRMELPAPSVGRAITDIQRMQGEYEPPEQEGEQTMLRGSAPVRLLREYQTELTAYTRGPRTHPAARQRLPALPGAGADRKRAGLRPSARSGKSGKLRVLRARRGLRGQVAGRGRGGASAAASARRPRAAGAAADRKIRCARRRAGTGKGAAGDL